MAESFKFVKLSLWEISSYIAIWIVAVLYSIYHVYLFTRQYFEFYDDKYSDFKAGWSLVGRKLDVSDEEWKIYIPFFHRLIPWIIFHISISQTLKYLFRNTTILCTWYITISFVYLWYNFGLTSTLCTLLLPCISCLLTSLRSKVISWFVHSITLAIIHYAKVSDVIFREWLKLDDEEYFILTATICWIQLRSISYAIDSIESYNHVNIGGFFKDLLQNVAYCLYLPTLFMGPIILYEQFVNGINKPFTSWNKEKLIKIILSLVRYTFWMYFTEFFLHFLYFNALRFHPQTVMEMKPWAFYGLGYCMGQYFLNKYVVLYGLTSTICRADDVEAPPHPKCIGRVHLYSDMWKHFDRGLYKFLIKYIYIPYNPKTSYRKFLASALCFTFIYLWHGMQLYIFIWTFLNLLGLIIENLAKSLSSYFYTIAFKDNLSPQNKRRLECALASPLLAFSAISNFYFFAGDEIGHMYILRFFKDSWKTNFILLFVLYCCCQTSTEVKQLEEKKSLEKKKAVIK